MATSQNGWAVDHAGTLQDRTDVHGVVFPNGVRRGDVATVLFHLADRFHHEVEPLVDGWCWGWYVKGIEGGTSISNHASGTAIDLNAERHPLGQRGTFTPDQRKAIHRVLEDLDGVVRWGGDYVGRPDEMHFEINRNASTVAALAKKIRETVVPNAQDVAEAVADRLRIPDNAGMWDKGGADLNNDKSGVAVGVRRQVNAAVAANLAPLFADPASLPDPEAHPLVQAVRYVLEHPRGA